MKQNLIAYFSNPENYSMGYYNYNTNKPVADWCNAQLQNAVDIMPENEVAEAEQEGLNLLRKSNPELFK